MPKVGDLVVVDGVERAVRYVTGPDRVLADIGEPGLPVLAVVADTHNGEGWQLSGDPATAEETAFIEAQAGYGQTITKVTGP